jgi:hypothetical protein
MPIFPGTANFIQNVIFHPCARPWFFYVLTALPAAVKAIVTVRTIDIEDIMRERARDFAHGPVRRTGRSVRHSIRGLIQDDAGPRKHWSQKAVANLIRATNPLEYFGLAVLLLFAADRFFYDWQALLLSWRFCEGDPDSGPLQRGRPAGGFFVGAATMPDLLQNRSGWNSSASLVEVPPGSFWANMSINAGYKGAGSGTWRSWVKATDAFGSSTAFSPDLTLESGHSGDMMATGKFFLPFGGSISWGVDGDPVPTGLDSTGGTVIVMKQTF